MSVDQNAQNGRRRGHRSSRNQKQQLPLQQQKQAQQKLQAQPIGVPRQQKQQFTDQSQHATRKVAQKQPKQQSRVHFVDAHQKSQTQPVGVPRQQKHQLTDQTQCVTQEVAQKQQLQQSRMQSVDAHHRAELISATHAQTQQEQQAPAIVKRVSSHNPHMTEVVQREGDKVLQECAEVNAQYNIRVGGAKGGDKDLDEWKVALAEDERDRELKERTYRKRMRPLNDVELKELDQAWETRHDGGVVAEIDNVGVIMEVDFERMRPKGWLNDELINGYGRLIMKRGIEQRKGNAASPRVLVMSSFFFAQLSSADVKEKGQLDYNYEAVRKWTNNKKLAAMGCLEGNGSMDKGVFGFDKVLFPINLNGNHWAVGVADINKGELTYWDPLGMKSDTVRGMLCNYMNDEYRSKVDGSSENQFSWRERVPTKPIQENDYDCGIFACFCIDWVASGGSPIDSEYGYKQADMPRGRRRIALEICRGKLLDFEAEGVESARSHVEVGGDVVMDEVLEKEVLQPKNGNVEADTIVRSQQQLVGDKSLSRPKGGSAARAAVEVGSDVVMDGQGGDKGVRGNEVLGKEALQPKNGNAEAETIARSQQQLVGDRSSSRPKDGNAARAAVKKAVESEGTFKGVRIDGLPEAALSKNERVLCLMESVLDPIGLNVSCLEVADRTCLLITLEGVMMGEAGDALRARNGNELFGNGNAFGNELLDRLKACLQTKDRQWKFEACIELRASKQHVSFSRKADWGQFRAKRVAFYSHSSSNSNGNLNWAKCGEATDSKEREDGLGDSYLGSDGGVKEGWNEAGQVERSHRSPRNGKGGLPRRRRSKSRSPRKSDTLHVKNFDKNKDRNGSSTAPTILTAPFKVNRMGMDEKRAPAYVQYIYNSGAGEEERKTVVVFGKRSVDGLFAHRKKEAKEYGESCILGSTWPKSKRNAYLDVMELGSCSNDWANGNLLWAYSTEEEYAGKEAEHRREAVYEGLGRTVITEETLDEMASIELCMFLVDCTIGSAVREVITIEAARVMSKAGDLRSKATEELNFLPLALSGNDPLCVGMEKKALSDWFREQVDAYLIRSGMIYEDGERLDLLLQIHRLCGLDFKRVQTLYRPMTWSRSGAVVGNKLCVLDDGRDGVHRGFQSMWGDLACSGEEWRDNLPQKKRIKDSMLDSRRERRSSTLRLKHELNMEKMKDLNDRLKERGDNLVLARFDDANTVRDVGGKFIVCYLLPKEGDPIISIGHRRGIKQKDKRKQRKKEPHLAQLDMRTSRVTAKETGSVSVLQRCEEAAETGRKYVNIGGDVGVIS